METVTIASTLLVVAAVLLDYPAVRAARLTSLVAANRWETLSLVAIGAVEWCVATGWVDGAGAWAGPLRWCAASTAFCGWMARLGARRPHGAGWQFVVATLWGVLALPAAEVLFLQRGQSFEIHAARGGFLWVLILGGIVNTAPTRWRGSGILAAVGQGVLFASHLPGLRWEFSDARAEQQAILIAAGLLTASRAWRACLAVRQAPRAGLDGAWLDFRDEFGAWWALRVLEQINAVAVIAKWPVRLEWSGFRNEESTDAAGDSLATSPAALVPVAGEEPRGESAPDIGRLAPPQLAALQLALWNLLRRFVAPEWTAGRLGDAPGESADQAN